MYLVTEWCPGTLDTVIASPPYTPSRDFMRLAVQLCEALAYLHNKGIAHRGEHCFQSSFRAGATNRAPISLCLSIVLERRTGSAAPFLGGLTVAGWVGVINRPEALEHPDRLWEPRADRGLWAGLPLQHEPHGCVSCLKCWINL
jgi:hypothetical protein